MKKIYTLLFIVLIYSYVHAQSISSITISPPQPTVADSIKIIIENTFPSGTCEGYTLLTGTTANTIDGYGIHCIGMLAVICTDYDTLIFPPGQLSAGTYSFHYTLETGSLPNCFAIGLPINTTISFNVNPSTDINEVNSSSLNIFPNPSDGIFSIFQKAESDLKIFSAEGRMVYCTSINPGNTEIDCGLSPGVYFVFVERSGGGYFQRLLIK